MKNVLVLGGTRFFGRRLVSRLIEAGADVTILTRGVSEDPFGDKVQRLQADRTDPDALRQAVEGQQWDVVYDNICYTPEEAEQAAEIFAGRTGLYVLTSTLAVYDNADHPLQEGDFDPYNYPVQTNPERKYSYKEGKRLSEAVLFGRSNLAVAAVRFPIVLGTDDYTKRLWFHIEHAAQGEPIGLPAPDAQISFVHAEEAAACLQWIGEVKLEGPVNACSDGTVSVREIMGMIELEIGQTASLVSEAPQEHQSPFGVPQDWVMSNARAAETGFTFWNVKAWMPELIRELAADLKKRP
ncbi:NAD-dependent epimerase/dehydratase family protein [Paenibacillus sp. 7541]|uniref:NAD-dependent epimerase/dehydratase family protein n=1 Tax=Paenibacillus sp. 7541 TaxID=2026236 RepID=UPI000BA5A1A5|nr:NAD-dependent epimerase/dehydratase family protein [Paenibacillus sp. 7541]PAK53505.1 NAD-dependent dehydratase [Paenibacillus sp. 7541]